MIYILLLIISYFRRITVAIYLAGFFVVFKLLKYWLKWNRGTVDRENEIDSKGKIVIVTGASSGIGKYAAQGLAERGATVILACITLLDGEKALEEIRAKTINGELIVMEIDLASLESVRKFAKEFKNKFSKLDILINNAGVWITNDIKRLTKEGFEEQFGINHLGHFLLTNLLIDHLKLAEKSRIVIVSSLVYRCGKLNFDDIMHENSLPPRKIWGLLSGYYCNSKLANSLFNIELSKRLKKDGIHTYALCPGFVATEIGKEFETWLIFFLKKIYTPFTKTAEEGASTTLHCALSKSVANHSGEMYRNCEFWDPRRRSKLSEEDAERLWILSEKLVGLKMDLN